ncbi:MAG: polysaccharide pyruvyl transferase family protein [Pirellulaceae bacterium]|nr:polysaccharide pyruvyl transferase family protein [Pirellulaceae bacterium]
MNPNKRAVLLNDTTASNHHGCARVVRTLCTKLSEHGIDVAATSVVRHRWWDDRRFLQHLSESDLVVINGEGTLHHGRPHGENLLKVVDHPACRAIPVVLVNALYQDNPTSWNDYLKKMSYLVARDSRSAAALSAATGRDIEFLPDLSLCSGFEPKQAIDRQGIVLGDSVRLNIRRALVRNSSNASNLRYVPIKKVARLANTSGASRSGVFHSIGMWWLFALYNGTLSWKQPAKVICENEQEYLRQLRSCAFHLTGRFHSVCLSMITRTPFAAVASNSWKIEALLDDAGLSKQRQISLDEIGSALQRPEDFAFSDNELDRLNTFLAEAGSKADRIFAHIAQIAARCSP